MTAELKRMSISLADPDGSVDAGVVIIPRRVPKQLPLTFVHLPHGNSVLVRGKSTWTRKVCCVSRRKRDPCGMENTLKEVFALASVVWIATNHEWVW